MAVLYWSCPISLENQVTGQKTCKTCFETKELPEFGIDRRRPDMHRSVCLVCFRRRAMEVDQARTQNPEVAPAEKQCSLCKKRLPASSFSVQRGSLSGLKSACRDCANEKRREDRRNRDPEKLKALKAQERKHRQTATERVRLFLWAYLSTHPCVQCGEDRPILLDFDHIDRKDKTTNISEMKTRSLEAVQKELSVCQVLCVVCHRFKTAAEENNYRHRWTMLDERPPDLELEDVTTLPQALLEDNALAAHDMGF